MDEPRNLQRLYRELADGYANRSQPQFRDRFLILAADAALAAGDQEEAERCRQHLLSVNPHHLVKPYESFARAMEAPDVRTYVEDMRRHYPQDVAVSLWRSMREVDARESRQVPVTAPLINFEDVPDLLMSDENETLKIFSLRDERPSGIPPTLPPEKFQSAPGVAAAKRQIPQTLFEVQPPLASPPKPQSAPAPAPRPAPRQEKPAREPVRPVARSAPATRMPTPVLPGPVSQSWEPQPAGAWLPSVLFAAVAISGAALIFYALIYPFFGSH
jgi:hypothetical protein